MIAVVDTSVIIVALGQTKTKEEAVRKESVIATLERLRADRVSLAVPAPAIAELGRSESATKVFERFAKFVPQIRVESFAHPAAEIAARIGRLALQARPLGKERGAVKFDALIAATAHVLGARFLLTEDRDLAPLLRAIDSKVEALKASEYKGQMKLLSVGPPVESAASARPRRRKKG